MLRRDPSADSVARTRETLPFDLLTWMRSGPDCTSLPRVDDAKIPGGRTDSLNTARLRIRG